MRKSKKPQKIKFNDKIIILLFPYFFLKDDITNKETLE